VRALGPTVRKAVKAALLPAALPNLRRAGDVVILVYHRVGGTRLVDVAEDAFERQIAFLARRGWARSLDEALGDGRGGVVVTFDDGSPDFHDRALPRLVAHRVPAVLYLTTGPVDGGNGEALSWDMVRDALSTGLVTVGAHTHTHPNLARVGDREAEEEIRRSRELIEDRLGVPCRHFAYPFGVVSEGAERAVRRLFETAAVVGSRVNRRGRTDRHRLGRFGVLRTDGPALFAATCLGLLDAGGFPYGVLRRTRVAG
jgi:peptidoglycan/xylan/chitin deacetylase (PgdA/CDA1 family)